MTATLTIAGAPPQEPTMADPAHRITPRPLPGTPADIAARLLKHCPACKRSRALCATCAGHLRESERLIRERQRQAGDTEEATA